MQRFFQFQSYRTLTRKVQHRKTEQSLKSKSRIRLNTTANDSTFQTRPGTSGMQLRLESPEGLLGGCENGVQDKKTSAQSASGEASSWFPGSIALGLNVLLAPMSGSSSGLGLQLSPPSSASGNFGQSASLLPR